MTRDLDKGGHVVAERYHLFERLRTGGTGTVWRGEDTVLGRPVAVKEVTLPMEATAAEREILRERVRREAQAAAQLDHPGAVVVHDVVEEGSATYLVMQYVPARSLSEVIAQEGPLSPQRTAHIGLAVLGVLRVAHAQGIIHRDVKPSNVLLSADHPSSGRVFLTDFGIASALSDPSVTSMGLLVGSPGYIAPERIRGETPGPASDLWSLGATLFAAVEGRPPYEGGDPMATLIAVVVGESAPFDRAGPLQPVLAALLERVPGERPTAAEVETALSQVATSAAEPAPTALLPPPRVLALDAARPAVLHLVPRAPAEQATRRVEPEGATVRTTLPAPPPPPSRAAERAPFVAYRGPRPRRRTRWLAWAGLLLAAVVGVTVTFALTRDTGAPAGRSPEATTQSRTSSGLPPLPSGARTPSEQLRATITALADLTARDRQAVGDQAEAVLARLREVEVLDGGPRRSAAVVAHTDVGAAVASGDLDPAVGQRVQDVLDGVARPERLIDLVELVAADPAALGPGGPQLLAPLIALDHEISAERTAMAAVLLLRQVDGGAEAGRLSEAFRTAAVPTLQELADPASYLALRRLLTDVARDADRIGPAGAEVLSSLRAIAELPVFPQGNEADELLALVRQDGQVDPGFRDAAVPILAGLVR